MQGYASSNNGVVGWLWHPADFGDPVFDVCTFEMTVIALHASGRLVYCSLTDWQFKQLGRLPHPFPCVSMVSSLLNDQQIVVISTGSPLCLYTLFVPTAPSPPSVDAASSGVALPPKPFIMKSPTIPANASITAVQPVGAGGEVNVAFVVSESAASPSSTSSSSLGSLCLWNTNTGACELLMDAESDNPVQAIGWPSRSRLIVATSRTVYVWNIGTSVGAHTRIALPAPSPLSGVPTCVSQYSAGSSRGLVGTSNGFVLEVNTSVSSPTLDVAMSR